MSESNATPGTPDLITVTPEQLKKMIDDGIEQARKDETVELDGIRFDYDKFADAMAGAISKVSGRRQVTVGEYVAKLAASRSKMRRKFFQHGIHVLPVSLSNAEIDLLNQITHSGRYFERLVEVRVSQDGAGDETEDVVYLTWPNATNDDKMAIKSHFRNLEECLRVIVAEQKQEDKEADLHAPATAQNRQHFGRGRATREARQAAGLE